MSKKKKPKKWIKFRPLALMALFSMRVSLPATIMFCGKRALTQEELLLTKRR